MVPRRLDSMLIIKLEALGASVKRQSGPCMNV